MFQAPSSDSAVHVLEILKSPRAFWNPGESGSCMWDVRTTFHPCQVGSGQFIVQTDSAILK